MEHNDVDRAGNKTQLYIYIYIYGYVKKCCMF